MAENLSDDDILEKQFFGSSGADSSEDEEAEEEEQRELDSANLFGSESPKKEEEEEEEEEEEGNDMGMEEGMKQEEQNSEGVISSFFQDNLHEEKKKQREPAVSIGRVSQEKTSKSEESMNAGDRIGGTMGVKKLEKEQDESEIQIERINPPRVELALYKGDNSRTVNTNEENVSQNMLLTDKETLAKANNSNKRGKSEEGGLFLMLLIYNFNIY
ncbi:hypothetical protein AX774_g5214 [Zancudomyces culisetae]|uniref:Uncharacterized protein n=1 Tax=Zancudomyces culisetae TaxID=1213189 RepID=A0A1R1PK35_ZANCU|nr:hypothetical protein AX774_g5214 [Zancudomyces culisetae]|eukprot:OMH81331.1 hypothetical protein AX774_g5214 [Zancudomyces culisetae]